MGRFRDAIIDNREFVITFELVPGRGFTGRSIDIIHRSAEEIKNFDGIHAISLTDNAGGNPALLADVLGQEIVAAGVDIIVHFSCKDMNRNFIESRAFALQRQGVSSLLVITGDYPISGFLGLPKPVFDVDSVTTLQYLKKINEGLEIQAGRKTQVLDPTSFLLGAVASPFKWTEASSVMQYYKLEKKIRAGADYIITQLGFDARKFREMIRYVRQHLKVNMPIIGSVYVLSSGAARFMQRGEVPGCYVSDRLVATLSEEAKAGDKGKGARLERAARQVAILKGLGYNGAHIEGLNLRPADVKLIIGRAREINGNWRDHLTEFGYAPDKPFYIFRDGESFTPPKSDESPVLRETRRRAIPSLTFWGTRVLHKLFFVKNTLGYKIMRGLSRFTEKKMVLYHLFTFFERLIKRVLFDCRHCDDCALFEMYYLCPEARCPKGMRIGPCGGSRVNGRCEVFEEQHCIWERVYWRAKNRRECDKLKYIISPRDWKLYETNSWINYFLGHDHSGTETGIPENIEA